VTSESEKELLQLAVVDEDQNLVIQVCLGGGVSGFNHLSLFPTTLIDCPSVLSHKQSCTRQIFESKLPCL
jgi:hypothetical protein